MVMVLKTRGMFVTVMVSVVVILAAKIFDSVVESAVDSVGCANTGRFIPGV
jgi:diacylglycerol kinase